MSEPYLSQIIIAGYDFAPRGYAQCNGQLLSIQQNAALFSLLGTFYGGNGVNTFALPDMRGRAPMFFGNGPGLTPRTIGQVTGAENHTLSLSEMPAHNHGGGSGGGGQACSTGPGTSSVAAGRFPGITTKPLYADAPTGTVGSGIGVAGGNQAHPNQQPYTVMNFIIALQGIFPSRN